MPLPPKQKDYYSYPEVTAPNFPKWRGAGAKALVTGFVQSRSDGRLTFGCYVYDVEQGRELGRMGFIVSQNDWRRAAHKCSGMAYKGVTGVARHFRHPHRLCRRRRRRHRPHQARRGDGQRRLPTTAMSRPATRSS